MIYVTATDKFLSGWGEAEGKINRLIFECEEDTNECLIVYQNCLNHNDFKNVNICYKKPYYNKDRYYPQYKTKEDYPNFYIEGYFKK